MSPDDILLKRELDRLASSYPNFKVYIAMISSSEPGLFFSLSMTLSLQNQVFYTVDKPSADWRGGVGFVSKDMVLKGLPGPGEDSLILVSSS